MKLALILSLSVSVLAMARNGSECGLVDSTDEYTNVRTQDLDQPTREAIAALPTLTKQQIIIAANANAKDMNENRTFKHSYDAAVYMERGRGNFSIIHATAGNTKITEIRAYPGDNANGYLFARGTKRIIGQNGDDSIVCVP